MEEPSLAKGLGLLLGYLGVITVATYGVYSLMAGETRWTTVLTITAAYAGMIALLGSACAVARFVQRGLERRKEREPRQREKPTSRAERKQQKRDADAARKRRWGELSDRLGRLQNEYLQVETDPQTLLKRPLILDVDVPATANFHDALERAEQIDFNELPATDAELADSSDIVDAAVAQFNQALTYATKAGTSTLSRAKRSKLTKAKRLLDVALDDRTNAHERDLAEDKAARLLDAVITRPKKHLEHVRLSNSQSRRKALTAGC